MKAREESKEDVVHRFVKWLPVAIGPAAASVNERDIRDLNGGAMRRVLTFLSSNVMSTADAREIELNLRLQDSAASAAREIADLQLACAAAEAELEHLQERRARAQQQTAATQQQIHASAKRQMQMEERISQHRSKAAAGRALVVKMDAESHQLEQQRQQLIQHTATRTFAPAELAVVRQHVDAACESLQTIIKSDAYLSETVVLPGSNPLDDHGAVTNLWQHPSWRAALNHELVQHAPGTILQALLDSTEQQCAALQHATDSIDLVADARALQLQIEGAEGDVAQKADPKRSLLDLVLDMRQEHLSRFMATEQMLSQSAEWSRRLQEIFPDSQHPEASESDPAAMLLEYQLCELERCGAQSSLECYQEALREFESQHAIRQTERAELDRQFAEIADFERESTQLQARLKTQSELNRRARSACELVRANIDVRANDQLGPSGPAIATLTNRCVHTRQAEQRAGWSTPFTPLSECCPPSAEGAVTIDDGVELNCNSLLPAGRLPISASTATDPLLVRTRALLMQHKRLAVDSQSIEVENDDQTLRQLITLRDELNVAEQKLGSSQTQWSAAVESKGIISQYTHGTAIDDLLSRANAVCVEQSQRLTPAAQRGLDLCTQQMPSTVAGLKRLLNDWWEMPAQFLPTVAERRVNGQSLEAIRARFRAVLMEVKQAAQK